MTTIRRLMVEWTLAMLCVWVAAFHTTAGTVIRFGVTRLAGRPWHEPFLDRAAIDGLLAVSPTTLNAQGHDALALAMWKLLSSADDASVLRTANETAAGLGLPPISGPQAVKAVLDALRQQGLSTETALLAMMVGPPVALYAAERATLERRPLTLAELGQQLPQDRQVPVRAAAHILTVSTAYQLSWPVETTTPITSGFGYRQHPLTGAFHLHRGIDLALPVGTGVSTPLEGIVIRRSEDALNGLMVTIDHGFGVSTTYCHLSAALVLRGQRLRRGDVLGLTGNSGQSTGPHLHYQLVMQRTPVDPVAVYLESGAHF
jgi:murein DD-endopeptidase